jgi:hypothetical protein
MWLKHKLIMEILEFHNAKYIEYSIKTFKLWRFWSFTTQNIDLVWRFWGFTTQNKDSVWRFWGFEMQYLKISI